MHVNSKCYARASIVCGIVVETVDSQDSTRPFFSCGFLSRHVRQTTDEAEEGLLVVYGKREKDATREQSSDTSFTSTLGRICFIRAMATAFFK